jgi:hypothetical protein
MMYRLIAPHAPEEAMEMPSRSSELQRLDVLVGQWEVEVTLVRDPPITMRGGRTSFEWAVDDRFLIQRTDAPDRTTPSSLSILAYDDDRRAFTMHYFDSRGVVRVYAMTFENGVWTLLREKADFSPLPFSQRFTARLEDGGATIRGVWEKTNDQGAWEPDLELIYRRVP